MTPQERQMIDDLFERLARVEDAPKDADASTAIAQGLRRAPSAVYALVQTVLVQDEALRRANEHIEQLERGGQPAQHGGGGFLDSMRDALFGGPQNDRPQARGSVPSAGSRPVWNSAGGQGYGQQPQQGGFNQPQMQQPQAPVGRGGSFLGTAAAAAAGMVGGSLLMNSIGSLMGGGGNRHAFGDQQSGSGGNSSNNDLSREAGVNDIGSQGRGSQEDQGSSQGFSDHASYDDQGDGGFDDGGGFDGGGDSDYA